MKAKLYKAPNLDYYWLRVDEQIFAATDGPPLRSIDYWLDISDDTITKRQLSDLGMLSIKNCEAIVNGYDLDELSKKYANKDSDITNDFGKGHREGCYIGYLAGFQKALEILGDKKFSVEDMKNAIEYGIQSVLQAVPGVTSAQSVLDRYKQSLQRTEWDVEILMESKDIDELRVDKGSFLKLADIYKPTLDAEGCLILKRI